MHKEAVILFLSLATSYEASAPTGNSVIHFLGMCPVSYLFKEEIIPVLSKKIQAQDNGVPWAEVSLPPPLLHYPFPEGPHHQTLSPVSMSRDMLCIKKHIDIDMLMKHLHILYRNSSILHTLFCILPLFF